jgi:hypothetical protein
MGFGVFKSFGDAPGGFSEESKEVTAVGAEYSYQDSLQCEWVIFMKVLKRRKTIPFLRAGFKYNVVKVDVSYLFSAQKLETL